MTCDVGNSVLAWERHINIARLHQLMGAQPSSLDKWISNVNTALRWSMF